MEKNENKTQWHPGFCAAVQLELSGNKEDLEYYREVNLSRKPLQMDLLIVTKRKEVSIQNQIGFIFRTYNIMEYKSPGDGLDIDTFYKVHAYACLYKQSGTKINAYRAQEITVSMIRDGYPESLLKTLEEEGFIITNPYPGIYYVSGNVMFQTQIIVSSQLDKEGHIWLTSLKRQIEEERYSELLRAATVLTQKEEKECADAVIEVVSSANMAMIQKWKEETEMACPTLEKIMAPEIEQWKLQARQEGWSEGEREGKISGMREGRREGRIEGKLAGRIEAFAEIGLSISEIAEKVDLSEEEVIKILKGM